MDDIETLLIYEDEKKVLQRLHEEYEERRKKLIDKLKNYENYSGEDGGSMVLIEGESKPTDFPLKAKSYLVGFDEHGNDIWQDIKHDKSLEEINNE